MWSYIIHCDLSNWNLHVHVDVYNWAIGIHANIWLVNLIYLVMTTGNELMQQVDMSFIDAMGVHAMLSIITWSLIENILHR